MEKSGRSNSQANEPDNSVRNNLSEAQRAAMQLAAIVESAEDAIVSKDLSGIVQSWNPAAERIFGYTADEMVGQPILTIIPKDRQNEEDLILGRIRAGERVKHFETIRCRKDGALVDISLTISPIKDPRGAIVGASKIARDIRERKEAERTRELLLQEIKHRVKNLLTVVQAVATRTFRTAPNAELSAFLGRVQALADSHSLLTQKDLRTADVHQIAALALLPFEAPQKRVTSGGPSVALNPNKTLLLSMALHELATNAVKYGALSNDVGTIALNWSEALVAQRRTLLIRWQEFNGPGVLRPAKRGFGISMIERAFAGEGGSASFDFGKTGLVCAMALPL